MALRKKNYTNHQVNLFRREQDSVTPKIESRPKTVYVSEETEELVKDTTIKSKEESIVITSDDTSYTPRMMRDNINIEYPQSVGACNIDETVFLAKFQTLLMTFIGEGSHKWNFLTVEQITKLIPGQTAYKLPENYDKMISVSLDPDCLLNPYNKPIELTYLDYQQTSFPYGKNYYSLRNNNIYFHNQQVEEGMKKCNNCGKCSTCQKIKGSIKLKYHITAPIPTSMDQSMSWMSQHAYFYLKTKMALDLHILADQSPSAMLVNDANNLFHNLQSWDSNLVPVKNKQVNNKRYFDFTNMYY